jgi:outer membrane protein assembly factor BamB
MVHSCLVAGYRQEVTNMHEAFSDKTAVVDHPQPYCMQTIVQEGQAIELKLEKADNPLPHGTLGDIGLATSVVGPSEFPLTILIQPFDRTALSGIEATSVRAFRWDSASGSLKPIWNSGINVDLGFVWTKISRQGIYVPIGLPRDTLLQATLRSMAHQRRYADPDSAESMQAITHSALAVFKEASQMDLEESRRLLTIVEAHTRLRLSANRDIMHGRGGYIQSFPLPQNVSLEDFRKRLAGLETPPGGLPEEALFYKPELLQEQMPTPENSASIPEIDQRAMDKLPIRDRIAHLHHHLSPHRSLSRNWWMYHHDARHTGHASGHSGITSTSVGDLQLRSSVGLDGSVVTIPSIVHGKIYVGTSDINSPGGGGTLYKIDLVSGSVAQTFSTTGRTPAYAQGIGGSPAIVDGKVYFSIIPGKVYCIDADTFTLLWVTDLRNADPTHNQPVQNDNADCWSSPLVVNGKVYVGCGEGEFDAFGFVYCLDAGTGNVIWLFCTNKLSSTADNSPNVIPTSAVGVTPLLTGFTQQPDPPLKGVSVWSSCAYSRALNRIYVGTGNSTAGDTNALPDSYYGSGVIALDAATGAFRGFFQPSPSDSYQLTDLDVDVPASPILFMDEDEDTEVLAIGSKNGSFFLLNADTMTPLKRRQLLPYDGAGNPLPNIDMGPGAPLHENMFGVFGAAALHRGLGRLFVGIGGYGGAIDSPTTPFMRTLDWRTLEDAWITTIGADGVARYIVPSPPMYTSPNEAGLSSPAVVNDVVFVSTTNPGFYAFDVETGLCLWSADGLAPGYLLGPAIYGNYVVIGSGNALNIYRLP